MNASSRILKQPFGGAGEARSPAKSGGFVREAVDFVKIVAIFLVVAALAIALKLWIQHDRMPFAGRLSPGPAAGVVVAQPGD